MITLHTSSSSTELHSASAPVCPTPPARPHFGSNQAVARARDSLLAIGPLPLREQAEHARILVEIGGVKTYWRRALSDLPPFHLTEQPDGARKLIVWRAEAATLQVFQRDAGTMRYGLLASITKHSAIFAQLPRYAFRSASVEQPVTFKQIVALRSLLRLTPEESIPALHIASASRLIEAIVAEPIVERLIRDCPVDPIQPNAAQMNPETL
jgi:hypothetical protein